MANQGVGENESWPFSNSDNSGDHQNLDKNTTVVPGVDTTGAGKKNKRKGKDGGAHGESDHEMHIWTERERRKKMRSMFASLHALLPQLPPKVYKWLSILTGFLLF